MSTALDIAAKELATLRSEVKELRARAGPKPLRISELLPGQVVSYQQLRGLHAAQKAGHYLPNRLTQVVVKDEVGRCATHFFGDPNCAWERFAGPIKAVRRIG